LGFPLQRQIEELFIVVVLFYVFPTDETLSTFS